VTLTQSSERVCRSSTFFEIPTSTVDHDVLLAAGVRRRPACRGDRPLSSLDLPSHNDAPSSPSSSVDPFASPYTMLHDEAAYDGILSASRTCMSPPPSSRSPPGARGATTLEEGAERVVEIAWLLRGMAAPGGGGDAG